MMERLAPWKQRRRPWGHDLRNLRVHTQILKNACGRQAGASRNSSREGCRSRKGAGIHGQGHGEHCARQQKRRRQRKSPRRQGQRQDPDHRNGRPEVGDTFVDEKGEPRRITEIEDGKIKTADGTLRNYNAGEIEHQARSTHRERNQPAAASSIPRKKFQKKLVRSPLGWKTFIRRQAQRN